MIVVDRSVCGGVLLTSTTMKREEGGETACFSFYVAGLSALQSCVGQPFKGTIYYIPTKYLSRKIVNTLSPL